MARTLMETFFRHTLNFLGRSALAFVAGVICTFSSVAQAPVPFTSLGYAYEKSITIDPAQVAGPADLTDFPVLVNIASDNNLRTVANGGHVQHISGWDISFVDQNGYKLDHETELYVAATGQLVAWVRVTHLSTTVATTIKLVYGNPQVTSNPSTSSVWKSE